MIERDNLTVDNLTVENLTVENLTWSWPNSTETLLKEINFTAFLGECHLITGATGSGKSTFLQIISGLLTKQEGYLSLPKAKKDGIAVGLILQNPDIQLLADNVLNEVLFGLTQLSIEKETALERSLAALEKCHLADFLTRAGHELSMGQQYRLLIASMLALQAKVIILDEPCAQLDLQGLKNLAEIISELKKEGHLIIYTSHRQQSLLELTDYHWHLEKGKLLKQEKIVATKTYQFGSLAKADFSNAEIVLEGSGLSYQINDNILWSGLNLNLRAGEIVLIHGENGCGKSSLLKCLAGFSKLKSGEIKILGQDLGKAFLGQLMYIPQDPAKVLFATSLNEEIMFGLKRLTSGNHEKQLIEVLNLFSLSDLAEYPPRLFSYGQKHLASVASLIASYPKILLLDDPLAGLDRKMSLVLLKALEQFAYNKMSILIVSHENSLATWVHRSFKLDKGLLFET